MITDTFTANVDGKQVEFSIKSPSFKDQREAQKIYNQAFADAVQSGCIVRGRLDDLLREQGLWDENKERKMKTIQQQIFDNEQVLAKGGISLNSAKSVAFEIRELRQELREVISSRTSLDSNTAEGQADNARFNYLVSCCLVYSENNKPYFDSYESYLNKSAEPVAIKAAQVLASRMYGLDDNYEANLSENKFLKQYNFVDDDLRLVNKDGHLVDEEGRLIDENGRFVNEKGEYVDKDGKPVDDNGDYVCEFKPFLDEDGNPVEVEVEVEKKNVKKKVVKRKKTVEVSTE
jgi:hypothetical protein